MGKTATLDIRVDEISGRYDRAAVDKTPDKRIDAQNELVKRSVQGGASAILLTEINNTARAKAHIPNDWRLCRDGSLKGGNSGDVGTLIDTRVWKVIHTRTRIISPDPGPGGQIACQITIVEHRKTGLRFLLTVAHLGSGVEGKLAKARKGRLGLPVGHDRTTHLYVASLKRWRKEVNKAARGRKVHHRIFAGDFNVNAHATWVRRMLDAAFGVRLVGKRPKGGTHGKRLIDLFMVSRGITVKKWIILPGTRASDHRTIRLNAHVKVANWRLKKKKGK